MDKVLAMLGADKLDEAQQKEIKETLETIIESKATEIAVTKVDEQVTEKETALKEEYDKKMEEYKDDITSKFSNFVDSILDEELKIPEKVLEFARKGELYTDLVDQFKIRLSIDEGLLDSETKEVLTEAKTEIERLKGELNETTKKSLDLEKDAQEMAAHIYLRQKCDGLTEAQKKHVIDLLGDVTVKEEIDKKFDIIRESSFGISDEKVDEKDDKKDDKKEDVEKTDETQKYECPECGAIEEVKTEEEGDGVKCPECGTAMKVAKESDDSKDGKGKKEVKADEEDKDKKKVDEDGKTPWDLMQESWISQLNG